MDDHALRTLLSSSKTIAIVGMSDKPDRDSNTVGAYLLDQGYRVIPVNPSVPEILGQKSYASLKEIPLDIQVDIVDVFRKSDAVPSIVTESLALAHPPKAVWLQLGIRDDVSAAQARQRGIDFVQDSCIRTQHQRLMHP